MDSTDSHLAFTVEIISQQGETCSSSMSAGESSISDLLLRSILLTVQKGIEENHQLLRTFKPLSSHDRSES